MQLKNFDSWIEYEGAYEGTGRSEKVWLQNPRTEQLGLFKFPKSKDRKNGDLSPNSTEFVSEHLAFLIAKHSICPVLK